MKKLNIALMALALTLSVSCKETKEEEMTDETMTEMEDSSSMDSESSMDSKMEIAVPMASKSGSNVTGVISFVQEGAQVKMIANLTGLEPGVHAIHLHENGDCSATDATSAGGHWNPKSNEHGDWDEGSHHMGDIGNLEANANGEASYTFSTDKWCMDCDDATKNIKGKGVIVHATADDFTSQPSGAAGARVACGVIE
ncbi:superoxide dismutase family protein [Nonlabens marinus]|uniref:Superoxide dismutase n=1 Tax=Nonlabens marinus S1-08 TaxID=1454201 RepID=W8VXK3_9FLAO|nr:superoxide dismutase family protein [Nonlabens marinus]BAO56077.1 superoxide dismutase [Nonlabens marinus S1-08]